MGGLRCDNGTGGQEGRGWNGRGERGERRARGGGVVKFQLERENTKRRKISMDTVGELCPARGRYRERTRARPERGVKLTGSLSPPSLVCIILGHSLTRWNHLTLTHMPLPSPSPISSSMPSPPSPSSSSSSPPRSHISTTTPTAGSPPPLAPPLRTDTSTVDPTAKEVDMGASDLRFGLEVRVKEE